MNHEELLAKIGTEINIQAKINLTDADTLLTLAHKVQALREVVKLHLPVEKNYLPEICELCEVEYPCPTIQTIEKELG